MTGALVARDDLSAADRAAMFTLLCAHFAGVEERQFRADLAQKDWAVLLRDAGGDLVGFSTLALYHDRLDDQPITIVYSGDTVVDPSAWSSVALPRVWIACVKRLHARHGRGRLFWLLITSGFRTYRLLPVFWRSFWPRFDQPTPEDVRALMQRLARQRFGDRYDPTTGLVRFDQPQQLREHLAGIPAGRRADPHIAFFAAVNPGHGRGDELVCITELCDANLTRAGWRMVRSGGAMTPAEQGGR